MTKAKNEAVKVGPFRVAPHIRSGVFSGRWLIDIPPHLGEARKRKRVFFPSKTAATSAARSLLRELQIDGALRAGGTASAGLTFADLARRWLTEQGARVATGKKRRSTLVADGYKLKALGRKFAGYDIGEIADPDVVAYQRWRIEGGCAAPTINSETGMLVQVLKWALDRRLIDRLPKVE